MEAKGEEGVQGGEAGRLRVLRRWSEARWWVGYRRRGEQGRGAPLASRQRRLSAVKGRTAGHGLGCRGCRGSRGGGGDAEGEGEDEA